MTTALDIALKYIDRGWNPVPNRGKVPIGDEWEKRVINAENAQQHFNGRRMNVGVMLGATSKNLTDVDLDCAEAIIIAPYILPKTGAIFGRASSRNSHRLYTSELATKINKATLPFTDPQTSGVLVELRIGGKGAQTIFPGSTHEETGEPIVWEQDDTPAAVAGDFLLRRVRILAACCLIARYWPGNGSRHQGALIIGGFLARVGWSEAQVGMVVEAIARAAQDEEWRDRRKAGEDAVKAHVQGKNTYGLPALAELIGEKVATKVAKWLDYEEASAAASVEASDESDGRPTILVQGGALHSIVSKAEAALIDAKVPFYARGGELVQPIVEETRGFNGKTKVARVRPVTTDMLRDHLSRTTNFMRRDRRTKSMVWIDPPHEVAAVLLSRDGEWQFPRLTGIISTPTIRPDGSLLVDAGYDAATGLLLMTALTMPPIPARPTRDDAAAALKSLESLLTEFPIVDKASLAVALSALITPVARGAMACTPLHACTAPEAGTGKSYLIDLASCLATGEKAPVMAAGRDEEETEKRLAAELITGQPIINIDNLNGDLGGDFLCQAIERPIIKSRILGRSESRRIDNTVTMYANGNNMRLVGDVVRRVLVCSLDAGMEQPETRQFSGDPTAIVLAERGHYVAAVLTVVRAYLVAKCPNLLPPLASFADWSRLVRSPLVWLGHDDPIKTIETARADDPVRAALAEFVAAWIDTLGTDYRFTAGELKDRALIGNEVGQLSPLYRAIIGIACAPGRSEIDAVRLGRWLSRNRGRISGGYKITGEKDSHSKQTFWKLAEVAR